MVKAETPIINRYKVSIVSSYAPRPQGLRVGGPALCSLEEETEGHQGPQHPKGEGAPREDAGSFTQ